MHCSHTSLRPTAGVWIIGCCDGRPGIQPPCRPAHYAPIFSPSILPSSLASQDNYCNSVAQVNIHIKAFLALQKQSLANNLEAKVRVKTQISTHSWGISEVQSMTSNAPKTCTQRLSLPGRSASNKATSCMLVQILDPHTYQRSGPERKYQEQTSAPPIKSRPRQPCRACLFSFVEKGFSGV